MRYLILPVAAALTIAAAQSPAPDTPAAARRVIEDYYSAIDHGNFRAAYAAWDRGGSASGKSFAAFRQGFAATARTRVSTGTPMNGDAGMMQRWIDVPVEVYATLKNGRRQQFTGVYRLRRVVAGVGAPASSSLWHIDSAKLRAS